MSIERAREHLRRAGVEDRVREFATSSATVALAAEALGCDPSRIAKTLSFDVRGASVLVVAAGDARVDSPKFKAEFGAKPKMLKPEDVGPRIGHEIGGVCPFGVNEGVEIYLDDSLRRFDIVYPACGSSNSGIPLTPDELEKITSPSRWVDVCKLPE